MFLIDIQPVNNAPTFSLADNVTVQADAGAQSVSTFATGFDPGGGDDEASQSVLDYVITLDAPGLFSILPDIANDGTLTFTPAIDRSGVAAVNVQVRDSGGVANGGTDLSTTQTFTITIDPVPDSARPTPVISTASPAVTNLQTIDIAIAFSKAVTGLSADDFQVTNGAISGITGSDTSYTATLTAINEGEVSIFLLDERVIDSFGLRNVTSNSLSVVYQPFSETFIPDPATEMIQIGQLPDAQLSVIRTVDLRGAQHELVLDAAKIAALSPDHTITVVANGDDTITFDSGWLYRHVTVADNQLQRVFQNGDAIVQLVGPSDWTNPQIADDVDGSGTVTTTDAFSIINTLSRKAFVDDNQVLVDPKTVNAALFRFFDVNQDGKLTASDALKVVNRLSRGDASGEGESLGPPIAAVTVSNVTNDERLERQPSTPSQGNLPSQTIGAANEGACTRDLVGRDRSSLRLQRAIKSGRTTGLRVSNHMGLARPLNKFQCGAIVDPNGEDLRKFLSRRHLPEYCSSRRA